MLPDKVRYPNHGRYMPHIVIGNPSQRKALMDARNTLTEHYLGVLVSDAPDELAPGQPMRVRFHLMYWPEEPYAGLTPGATFTLREGPVVVGFGTVLSEIEPD